MIKCQRKDCLKYSSPFLMNRSVITQKFRKGSIEFFCRTNNRKVCRGFKAKGNTICRAIYKVYDME